MKDFFLNLKLFSLKCNRLQSKFLITLKDLI